MKYTSNIDIQKKHITVFAGVLALAFVLTGCSSGGTAAPPAPSTTADISGTVTNLADVAQSDVAVEAVYTTPGDAGNVTTDTDINGAFSLTVEKNKTFYVRMTKSGFVSVNSEKGVIDADQPGADVQLPTPGEAQGFITTAFEVKASDPQLVNQSWVVVDVYDANGVEVNNVGISSPGMIEEVYTICDGTDSGGGATTGAPCVPDRQGPMYIAYFGSTTDVNVQAVGDTKTAPVRMGEITFIEFEQ